MTGMLAFERRNRIVKRVADEQVVHIGQIAEELGVSEMTIRRDLLHLERNGFLRRAYGGATAHLTREVDLTFNARALHNGPAKRRIGHMAAMLLRDVATFFVGIGTTTEQFARFMTPSEDVIVITESLPIASLLGTKQVKVVVLGGQVRRDELSCIGPIASATLSRYWADTAVIGAGGLSTEHGITELFEEEAENHRLMIARSTRVVVLADGSKIGSCVTSQVAPASVISTLITDETAPEDQLLAMRSAGIEVLVARREPGSLGSSSPESGEESIP